MTSMNPIDQPLPSTHRPSAGPGIDVRRGDAPAPSTTSKESSVTRKTLLLQMLFCLVVSFVLMLLLTRSSFLYPYNNWDDSNSYFSMGKSMFHGTLIYRDLFDQKGPYLYFLYGLCSLISQTSFLGVFIMEVIWGAADLYLLQNIMSLYCQKTTALFLSPILLCCMCASKSFYWGGCAEELCLPFLLLTLNLLLQTLHQNPTQSKVLRGNDLSDASVQQYRPTASNQAEGIYFTPRVVFIAGLCCGFVFCVKFTLMGFFLGFAILVILTCRSPREFLRLAGAYLAGIVVPFLPWLIYFAVTGGLDDWYRVYIYTNVFLYSDFGANSHGAGFAQKVYDLAKILYWLILDNLQYFAFVILGILWLPLRKGACIVERIAPVLLFGLTFLFIYIGGAHLPYYAFPLTAYAVLGMSLVGILLDHLGGLLKSLFPVTAVSEEGDRSSSDAVSSAAPVPCRSRRMPFMAVFLALSLAVSYAVILSCSWNMDYLHVSKDEIFLTAFTDDINADRDAGLVDRENTTLLNIGCLDSGLYTTTGIYPTCYWFQTQTLPGDEVTNAQLSYITEARTDYIVARDTYPEEIWEHYELIDTFHQDLQPQSFDYYLFRRKS